MTASELIDALGGNLTVAKIAGVGTTAVSNWRKFGVIPPRLYLRIETAAKERGVKIDPNLFREISSVE